MNLHAKVRSNPQMSVAIERFPIAGSFKIARGSKTEAVVVTVTLQAESHVGRGECVPYARYGETVEGVAASLENMKTRIERGLKRDELQTAMAPGAARNALDCALWDLEAKQSGVPAFLTADVSQPKAVTTAYTISLDTPEKMSEATKKAAHRPLLKIKLGAPGGDFERIRAVREAAPRADLIADANEGWTAENIETHLEACAAAGFSLIEQPLPQAQDEALREIRKRAKLVPLCADESVHDRAGLDRLVGLYDFINVKLDKTGGLTEALKLAQAAERLGLGLMVGCMVGTSLAMAPALLLAERARFVDLDGPLLLARDREGGLTFEESRILPPDPKLWG